MKTNQKTFLHLALTLATGLALSLGTTGCEQKSDSEKAADSLKDAAAKTGDAMKDAAAKTGEAVKEASKEVKKEVEKAVEKK